MSARSVASAGFGSTPAELPILLFPLLLILLDLDSALLLVVGAAVVVATPVMLLHLVRRGESPWVSRDGSWLRKGKRSIAANEITAASVLVAPWVPDATERSLTLVVEGPNGFRAAIGLRRRGRLVLTARGSTALATLISGSGIDLPRDKEDPRGRFSRVLYPTHLTRSDTWAIVLHPPADGEPLPIAQPGV